MASSRRTEELAGIMVVPGSGAAPGVVRTSAADADHLNGAIFGMVDCQVLSKRAARRPFAPGKRLADDDDA